MNTNFTETEIQPSVYLLEKLYNEADESIILKEFKNFDESQKNWDEAVEELIRISEENRDRFFSIKGCVRQEDGSIKLQAASW